MRFLNLRALAAALFKRSGKKPIVLGSRHALFGHLPESSLSEEFLMAAGANDVAKMEELRRRGADINFIGHVGFGTLTLIQTGSIVTQPSDDATPLIVALHNGAFDAALYLAREKADATYERVEIGGFGPEKALDFLLADHVPEDVMDTAALVKSVKNGFGAEALAQHRRNYQTDLYTSEQRRQIFDALVANTQNPLSLVSSNTLKNAIQWGRWEMIPKLAEIGVEIKDEHFVEAAAPIHRPHMAIQTMAAVLPFVRDVNVTDSSNSNAGHRAAQRANLAAFQWLGQRGLNKRAIANNSIPTYAHCVAANFMGISNEEERVAFAQYLVDHQYPIDLDTAGAQPRVRVQDGFELVARKQTPADVAFKERQIGVGLVFMRNGAIAKPEYLTAVIGARHYSQASTHDILEVIDILEEGNLLSHKTMREAFNNIVTLISQKEENVSAFAPVVGILMHKGLELGADEQNIADMIVAENKSVHSFLKLKR